MFCYQCEQTAKGKGCTVKGICGKSPEVAALQDLLIKICKGMSVIALNAKDLGLNTTDADKCVMDALFTTVTNVNFDEERMIEIINQTVKVKNDLKAKYEKECDVKGISSKLDGCAPYFEPKATSTELLEQAQCATITKQIDKIGASITGLQELLIYGLKGVAAYGHHARVLGCEDQEIYDFIHKAMAETLIGEESVENLFAMNMECGEIALKTMELLDKANTEAYGAPVPTKVHMGYKKGKAILVSGHDLKDLEELLKQTEGKGINIYTHGEMMPAHGYPELNKYPHLAGHYGGAWQKQREEFTKFKGSILMTTNCIQEPKNEYKNKIFTCGLVAWPDVTHIENRDFSKVIEAALNDEGFAEDSAEKFHTVGFAHKTVLSIAGTVIDAIKSGDIKRFMLVGGCDGHEAERNYFTEVVEKAPKDWIILTLGCGKFRVIDANLGSIGDIPRILDMGQCNDAFSAIKVAGALAEAFQTDVNSLPLSLVLSWFEQKAVCVLLALLYLGVKNIRLGPSLPAFITPEVLGVLVDKFNIMHVGNVDEDLQNMAAE
jgi:hydroxylamine reductase